MIFRTDPVQGVDDPATGTRERFDFFAHVLERGSIDASIPKVEPVESRKIDWATRVFPPCGEEEFGGEGFDEYEVLSFAETIVVTRVAEGTTMLVVNHLKNCVREFHFISPPLGSVISQVIRALQPFRVIAGMENGVVSKFVTIRSNLSPGLDVLEEATLQVRIERASKVVLIQEWRDPFEMTREGVVITERNDAVASTWYAREE